MAKKTVPERKHIRDEHKWDLTPLFGSDAKWESLYAEIEGEIESYAYYVIVYQMASLSVMQAGF